MKRIKLMLIDVIPVVFLLTLLACILLVACVSADEAPLGRNEYKFLRTSANMRYEEWETPRGLICVRMYSANEIDCEFPRD